MPSTASVTVTVSDEAGNPATTTLTFPAVAKGDQTLSGFEYSPASVTFGNTAPTLTAPTGAVTTVGYTDTPASVCTVNATSGTLTLAGVGSCVITATAASNSNYNGATAMVTVTVTIQTAGTLEITGLVDESVPEGIGYSATPELSGTPVGEVLWTVEGDDAELFTINASTGVLQMRYRDYRDPEDANEDNAYEVTVKAEDSDGNSDTHDVTVTVTDVPNRVMSTQRDYATTVPFGLTGLQASLRPLRVLVLFTEPISGITADELVAVNATVLETETGCGESGLDVLSVLMQQRWRRRRTVDP